MTNTCVNCDTPLIEGHRFCRVCGRRAEPAQRPPPAPPPEPVVEGCPSCGRAATADERFCRTCGTALTADAGAARPSRALPTAEPRAQPSNPPPAHGTTPRRPAAQTQRIAPAPAPAPAPAYGAAAQGPSSRGRGKTVRIVLLAVLGVAILAGGVFAGLTFLGSDEEPSRGGPPADGGGGAPDDESPPDSRLPSMSGTEMTSQIRQLLVDYHQGIVDGDLDAVFALLTERKKESALRRFGYEGWKQGQSTLAPYLQPSGLEAEIDYADPRTGVVRVRVSGMGYTNPRSSCSTWSGITWVKYEGEAFRYDPGYGTTLQRERDWKDRQPELLGTTC